jgi:tight adherence protein B
MRAVFFALVLLVGVALVEGVYFTIAYLFARRDEELKRRLQSLGGTDRVNVSLLRQRKLSNVPTLDALLRSISPLERLESLMEQADLPITVARLITYSTALGIAALTLSLALRASLGVAFLLGGFALLVPVFYVLYLRERRNSRLSEQLPDALDMMGRSLQAGHALTTSFRLVAAEMPEPVSMEFGRAYEEQSLGLAFERTILNMTSRCPQNPDLKIFAVSVIVQKETGGNLVEILDKIASTIRERYRFFGKLKALTAEGRVSAMILGALPIVMALFMWATNPGYAQMLVSEPVGRKFLIYAIVSWVLGNLWMRRMAKVEF